MVVCGGEFGRTPKINPAAGRDHWPHGFTWAVAGGGVRGGQVIGATDPTGGKKVERPHGVAIVAFQTAVDIDPGIAAAWAALARAVLYSGPPDGYSWSEHQQRG